MFFSFSWQIKKELLDVEDKVSSLWISMTIQKHIFEIISFYIYQLISLLSYMLIFNDSLILWPLFETVIKH